MYRVVCVSDEEIPTVIWKGPLGRKYEVAIIHEEAHFDALKNISRFYKLKNFCLDCEKPYQRARDHDRDCKVSIIKFTNMSDDFLGEMFLLWARSI